MAARPAAEAAVREFNAGNPDAALDEAAAALRHDPWQVAALRLMARLSFDRGDTEKALGAAQALCESEPGDPEGLSIRARSLARLGKPMASEARKALEALAASNAAAAHGRALLALDRKDGPEALHWLDRTLALEPGDSAARALRAACLARLGRLDQAQEDFDTALEKEPCLLRARMGRAKLHSARGAFAKAEADLRSALAASLGHAGALAALLGLRPEDEPALIAKALDRLDKEHLPSSQRIELSYAAAKALARTGDAARAFALAAEANAAQAVPAPYEAAKTEARLEADLHIAPCKDVPQFDGPQPIFVCGLPRTGTTLTEQILARHPDVAAGGELPFFRKAQAWLFAQSDPQAALAKHRDEFARAYRDGIATRAQGRSYIVDKMPENWRCLGLIRHVLGPVRILRLTRDPRDTALSIFLEHFAEAEAFAHAPDAIAHTLRLEQRAFTHWAGAGLRPPIQLAYEQLVSDPATEIPRLLDALDLPFDPACLAPEESEAAAATPSRWQVRRKINTGSIGRWKAFAPHAPEFFALVDAAAGADVEPSP